MKPQGVSNRPFRSSTKVKARFGWTLSSDPGTVYLETKHMKTVEKKLLQTAIGFGGVAGWLLICDAGWIPARFALTGLNGVILHWQIFLAAAAVLIAVRDQVADLHCRCCGSHGDLSWQALLKTREILCTSCLTWDPGASSERQPVGAARQPVTAEYAELFQALKN